MLQEQDILQALKAIQDPDLHRDIVSLGFVKNIHISEDSVSLSIELTTPACPVKNEFKSAAEQILLSLPGIDSAQVTMTSRPAPVRQISDSGLSGVKNIIAVASCKGGVGKSTVAANLAAELSVRGFATGLLDTDIFGPSLPTLFQLHNIPVQQLPNNWIQPVEHNGLKLMSFGFLFSDQPVVMRGPMVSGYIQQILHTVAWGDLDYLILDLPPGTGDIQLTITQSIRVTGAVIVTTPQSLAIVDVARGIQMFEKVSVPMLGVVENMSWFVCPQCDTRHHLFGDGSRTPFEERFGLPTLAQLPIEKNLTEGLAAYQSHQAVVSMTDQVARALGARTAGTQTVPVAVIDSTQIKVTWDDGSTTSVSAASLRAACQCANCVDEYSGAPLLDPQDIPLDIHALEIQPIGHYAVSIKWSDGHDSGIYSWQLIRKTAAQ